MLLHPKYTTDDLHNSSSTLTCYNAQTNQISRGSFSIDLQGSKSFTIYVIKHLFGTGGVLYNFSFFSSLSKHTTHTRILYWQFCNRIRIRRKNRFHQYHNPKNLSSSYMKSADFAQYGKKQSMQNFNQCTQTMFGHHTFYLQDGNS